MGLPARIPSRTAAAGALTVICLAVLWMLSPAVARAAIQGPCDGSVTIDGTTYGPDNDTPDNPIVIPDEPGAVATWEGSTGVPITDHSGEIGIVVGPGVIKLADWSGENADLETTADGTYDLDDARDQIRFPLVGLYEVSGRHIGDGGGCSGTAMVRIDGPHPLTTPIGGAAAVGGVLAAFGVARSAFARVP